MPTPHRKCYIYKIVNVVNNKVYVGSTIDKDERWRQHLRHARYPKQWHHPLYRDMHEYGVDKFFMEVLEECLDNHLRLVREVSWIHHFACAYPDGYNIDVSGTSKIHLKKPLNPLTL